MKKILSVLLAVLFLSISVYADVLIEPEDGFYRTHAEECSPENKHYTASTVADLYHSPSSFKSFEQAEAGSLFYIKWIYEHQDECWGLVETGQSSYWINMHDLEPVYSHDEFITEHSSEIISEATIYHPEYNGWIILYEYPGSSWISDVLKTDWFSEGSLHFSSYYIDPQGNKWVYTPYIMQRSGWFNLTESVVQTEPVRTVMEVYVPDVNSNYHVLTASAVIFCCILTAVGLLWFKKKKQ